MIERIEDSDGNVIYDHATDADEPEQVLSAAVGLPRHRHPRRQHRSGREPAVGPALPAPHGRGGRRPATLKTGHHERFPRPPGRGLPRSRPRSVGDRGRHRHRRVGRQQRLLRHPGRLRRRWTRPSSGTTTWPRSPRSTSCRSATSLAPTALVDVDVDAMSGMLPGEFTADDLHGGRARRPPADRDRYDPPRAAHRGGHRQDLAGGLWRLRDRGAVGCARPIGRAAATRAARGGVPRPRRLGGGAPAVGGGEHRPGSRNGPSARTSSTPASARPFPGPIDASLAPTEECTPGEIPTSSPTPSPTPYAHADAGADTRADPAPDARHRRRSRRRAHRRASTPTPDARPRAPRPSSRRRPRRAGRPHARGRADARPAPRARRAAAPRSPTRG